MRMHRDAKADLIRAIPLFRDCGRDELVEICAIADEIDLAAGKHLATENADGRECVVIIEGRAGVYAGQDLVATLGAGDWFGEVSLVTGKPRNATVVAATSVHALVIEGHRFTQLLQHSPSIREKVEAFVDLHRPPA